MYYTSTLPLTTDFKGRAVGVNLWPQRQRQVLPKGREGNLGVFSNNKGDPRSSEVRCQEQMPISPCHTGHRHLCQPERVAVYLVMVCVQPGDDGTRTVHRPVAPPSPPECISGTPL